MYTETTVFTSWPSFQTLQQSVSFSWTWKHTTWKLRQSNGGLITPSNGLLYPVFPPRLDPGCFNRAVHSTHVSLASMSTASLTAFSVILLFSPRADSAACDRRVPSIGADGCYHYDISRLENETYTFREEGHSYVAAVCGNVLTPPGPCKSMPPSPAYWYTDSSCYVLGLLNDTATVSQY